MLSLINKKKKSKQEDTSVFSHLNELRKRLQIVVIVNLLATFALFSYAELLMQYLLDINPGMQLVYISPSELLLVYIQIAFLAAIIVCSPITIYQIWAFVEKGLYKREKIYILVSLFFGFFCFVLGVVFCYEMVLPITLEFFARLEITEITSMISVKSYASFANLMLFSFGAVFEMPVLVFLLTKLHILKPEFLKKHRGILIVLIFILAAIITPPDVVSQILLAIPMLILLQISIVICIVVDKTNKKTAQKKLDSL